MAERLPHIDGEIELDSELEPGELYIDTDPDAKGLSSCFLSPEQVDKLILVLQDWRRRQP